MQYPATTVVALAPAMASKAPSKDKDKSKVHKLSLKGSSKLVAEFVSPSTLGAL